jgi:hypothetical protein
VSIDAFRLSIIETAWKSFDRMPTQEFCFYVLVVTDQSVTVYFDPLPHEMRHTGLERSPDDRHQVTLKSFLGDISPLGNRNAHVRSDIFVSLVPADPVYPDRTALFD